MPSLILPAEEWRPDLAPLADGAEAVLNVLPTADGYEIMPHPVDRGPAGLPYTTQLLFSGVTSDGVSVPLAFAPQVIYRAVAGAWREANRPGGYNKGLPWEAVQWGDTVYAVNGHDRLQAYDIGAANARDVTDAPNHLTGAHIATVGQFLMLADVREGEGSGRYPYRVRWSGIGRPETWTPNRAIQADFSDIPSVGPIMGLVGGEYGLVIGQQGLARMDYIGPPEIFQITVLETDIGCEAPRSICQAGNMIFWWSRRGWRVSTGGPSNPIGLDKVDGWTLGILDMGRLDSISAVPLYREQAVMWLLPSRGQNGEGEPDEILCFSWPEQKWSRGKFAATVLGRASSPDVFTDDEPGVADLTDESDLITDGFGDSSVYPAAVVGTSLALLQPKGGITAQVVTSEKALIPGRRSRVTRVRPLVNQVPEALWMFAQSRDDQRFPDLRETGPHAPEDSGTVALNSSGMYHRFSLNVRAPFGKIMGVEVLEVKDTGSR